MSQNGDETATGGDGKSTKQELKVPCEVYSRIVGYLRPIQNWNKGKRVEFAQRRLYRMPGAAELGDETDGVR